MARVKLNLPEQFQFHTEITVRISDINYGGHLGNDAVLSLIHEARVRFLKFLGYNGEGDIEGLGIMMNDAAVIYKAESFHGDLLTISVAISDISRIGADLTYQLVNSKTGKEIARAKTGVIFYDYQQRKRVAVPESFKKHCRIIP